MESFIIPSSPNWYEPDVMACAPDNTLMYGSRNDLIVIKPTEYDQPDDIQIIPDAHYKWITAVNFNKNWGTPNKYAVTVSADKVIKVWDVETLQRKMSHNKHCSEDSLVKVIGVSFAGDNRVVSATSDGQVIIWNLTTNEQTVLDSIFKNVKGALACFSICPHEASRAAFGLRNGLVIIADLRRSGRILATYRGHKSEVISLSWCPVPVNVFPKDPNNTVGQRKVEDAVENKLNNGINKINKEEAHTNAVGTSTTDNPEAEKSCVETLDNTNFSSNHNSIISNEILAAPHSSVSTQRLNSEENPQLLVASSVAVLEKSDNGDDESCNDSSTVKTQVTVSDVQMETGEVTKNDTETASKKTDISNDVLKMTTNTIANDQIEVNHDTPTDRRTIPMELSESAQRESKILVREWAADECKPDTPTDRRNISMELSHSTASTPDVIRSETGDQNSVELLTPDTALKSEAESMFIDEQKQGKNHELPVANVNKNEEKLLSVSSSDKNAIKDENFATQGGDVPVENWREVLKIEEEPRKEFLLASSARDGYVYIWQTLVGPMATFFIIPQSKNNKSKSATKDVYNILCWATPHMLLTSSDTGELLGWRIPKPLSYISDSTLTTKTQTGAFRKLHNQHGKPITSIKAPIVYLDETNFLQPVNVNVWTTGVDRVLCNFDCDSKEVKSYYQSLNGPACYFAGCPLDPSRLAIGDEKNIKIWNLGQTNKKVFKFPTSFDKIHSVITTMAWHPSDENTVAFGTMEGRIGILTVSGKKLKTKVLTQYFRSEIYKLEWGPEISPNKRKLFANSEGVVVRFDPESNEDPEPIILPAQDSKLILNSLYTFSWSPDYSFLLGTSKTGACIKYSKDLTSYEVFYLQPRIDSIVWHPDAVTSQTGESASEYSKMFASVVMNTRVKLYSLIKKGEKEELTPLNSIENRSKTRIRAIQWNPFSVKNLIWVDDAGVAVVVDFISGHILHTYINPWLDGLVSVYWSPVDPDYVLIGTDNRKIINIKVIDYPALSNEETDAVINRIRKRRGNELTHNLPKAKEDNKEKENNKSKNKKFSFVPVFYTIKEKNQVSDLQKILQWKLEGTVDLSVDDFSSDRIGILDAFGDDQNLNKIFQLNMSSFIQNGNSSKINMMALFQGNINEVIKDAIDHKRVNTWIISVASMVSPQCWREACATYVQQLLEQSEPDIFEVLTFQLACHQVEEAVNFLCDRKLFREAYVLAKSRFGSEREIVTNVIRQWAKHCSYEGNYELAACCYITLGMFNEAAYLLFRRTNLEILEFAIKLASLAGNADLQKAIENKADALREPSDLTNFLSNLGSNSENLTNFIKINKTSISSELNPDSDGELAVKLREKSNSAIQETNEKQEVILNEIQFAVESQRPVPFDEAKESGSLVTAKFIKLNISNHDKSLASVVDEPFDQVEDSEKNSVINKFKGSRDRSSPPVDVTVQQESEAPKLDIGDERHTKVE